MESYLTRYFIEEELTSLDLFGISITSSLNKCFTFLLICFPKCFLCIFNLVLTFHERFTNTTFKDMHGSLRQSLCSLFQYIYPRCLVIQLCLTLRAHGCVARQTPLSMGILQARTLEWDAMPSSRGFSQPRDQTQVSRIAGGFFTIWATREAQELLEWVPYPFSMGSSWSRSRKGVSCFAGRFFTSWATREAHTLITKLSSWSFTLDVIYSLPTLFCCLVLPARLCAFPISQLSCHSYRAWP